MTSLATAIDREHLRDLHAREERLFLERHPASGARAATAGRHLVGGVPMAWMTRWPGAHPVFFDRAEGARFWDVDGHEYVDFCLGDTGAMAGHGVRPVADALHAQALRGITTMLPNDDAAWVGGELARGVVDGDISARQSRIPLADRFAERRELQLLLLQETQAGTDNLARVAELAAVDLRGDEGVILRGEGDGLAVLHSLIIGQCALSRNRYDNEPHISCGLHGIL